LHPTISWETNKEASRYNIQINVLDGTQLGEIVENGICTSTSYTVINELTPGLRYWLHIGAADALSHEVGSNLWTTFTVVRPERDLSISILTPGNMFTSTTIVNTTIQNLRLSNESDIVVQFFVNGSLATSKTITFLENASSTVLSARASPAAFEGKVYVGSADNSVYCLNGLTGAKVWSYATNGYASCSPAIAGGRVYIGSDDRNIYCLDTYTGVQTTWKREVLLLLLREGEGGAPAPPSPSPPPPPTPTPPESTST
jgi:hypothetical protein